MTYGERRTYVTGIIGHGNEAKYPASKDSELEDSSVYS
jgi:hypothetical protein